MNEKTKVVTADDIEKAFTDGSGKIVSLPDPAAETLPPSTKDETGPLGEKTVCDVMRAELILALAKKRIRSPRFRQFVRIWKALDALQRPYENRHGHWGYKMYAKYFEKRKKLQSTLALRGAAASFDNGELESIRKELEKIRSEISESSQQSDIPGFFFTPEFSFPIYKREQERPLHGKIVEYKKDPVKLGAFVAVDVGADMRDARIRFNKLPFLLGIDASCVCAACPSHLNQLRDYKFLNRTFTDRMTRRSKEKSDLAYAQTYEAAMKSLEIQRSRRENYSAKPKELDEQSVKSQSCFILSFDGLTEELDALVDACTMEMEIFDVITRYFRRLTSAQMGEMKIFLGENLGDVAEGKKAKDSDERGKPAGLGPFGGKPEDDDGNIYHDFRRIASRWLFGKIEGSSFFKKLVNGAIRECQNESGFEIARVYCRVARIEKKRDDTPHIYNLWLARMKNPYDSGQTLTPKERREMNPNQKRFWIPLSQFFGMPTTGHGNPERCDRPYASTQMNVINFIRRFNLPVPPEMIRCEERLNRSRSVH